MWTYSISLKTLTASDGNAQWRCKSGGIDNYEPLPVMTYTIGKIRTNFTDQRYEGRTGKPWFCELIPQGSTKRTGIGIHPDGGPPGTLGCIGLDPNSDTEKARNMLKNSIGETLSVTA
ncbi:L,D-transpeptidase family protein [Desulfovibrio cuneatus]|uniref:L,D-transpeptidase family protein n=1 Tax=Desulfovibrio cuneatus TaxID=159728 RepID=UPI0004869790|nr:L,D-transpeptidase family protein [Desulfovibrio cuneatus]